MRVETRVMERVSTVQGDEIAMSLDENATAHLMSVLTDLYSDTELAVVREYSTNALDAHIDAGVTRPIEVTLPSPLAPFFRVKDYGTGLSAEDIRNVFSRYGTSTKRESNSVVGMLGLGCKSALTYSDSFTVVSTKDGRTIQVQVARDEDGGGSMTVVSDEQSDDANGTEIVVPAKRGDTFASKAADFFRYWTPGTVLVNGEPPARIDGLWLSESLLLSRDADADTVVMGNVSYPFLEMEGRPTYRKGYGGGFYLVAFVDIGEVSFTPSRESLQSTKRTRERLAELRAESESLRDAAIIAQVADAPSAADAIAILREGQSAGFEGKATYQGRDVPLSLDRTPMDANGNRRMTHPDDLPVDASFLRAGHRYAKVKGERTFSIPLDGTPILLFEGFDGRDMTPTKRDKLAVWAESKGIDIVQQLFSIRFTTDERYWLAGREIYAWADVDAVKLTRRQTATADGMRPRGSYTVHGSRTTILAEEIDTSRPVYWYHGTPHEQRDEIRRGAVDVDNATVIALPANRVDKFVRDFPSAIPLTKAAKTAAESWLSKEDKDTVLAYVYQNQRDTANKLKGLDADSFDDPVLAKAIREASRPTSAFLTGWRKYQGFVQLPDAPPYADALDEYPLVLDGYRTLRQNETHVVIYCNAAYAARKGQAS